MASSPNKIGLCAFIIFLLTNTEIINGQVPECCSEVTGKCRRDCEQISLVNMALNPEERKFKMRNLHASCGETWTFFWNCMNRTLHKIDIGEKWYGRSCCHLPKTQACQMQCLQTFSTEFLPSSCTNLDDENMEFFKCVKRQKYADTCCSNATTAACKKLCITAFSNPLPLSMEIKASILDKCNSNVRECMRKVSNLTVSFSLSKDPRCCEAAHTARCRDSCRQILSPTVHRAEIVDMLQSNGCDRTSANKRLWQCIYMKEEEITEEIIKPNNTLLGLDRPKLQCCSRAVSTKCQKLCTDMSSNNHLAVREFENQCVSKIVENDLLQCLADVDEPCELGCEQLTHCTNFNDRPIELFRTCNTQADKTANTMYSIWQRGIIRVGNTVFHLKDISQCNPEEWKNLACTLNVKPCQKLDEIATKICRSDCENFLMPCIDKNFLSKGETTSIFCDKFAASHLEQCISLTPYLTTSKYQNYPIEVTTPCLPNPCYEDEVCIVVHTCLFRRGCQPYSCVPGCRMGQRSNLVVAKGTYVQLPMTPDVYNIVCYKVCYCNLQGDLVDCTKAPCGNNDNCWNGGKKIAHNTKIQKGCNICFCYAGTLTCTQKKCHSSGRDRDKDLPCNCPDHYVPVCGSNGKTYPSACVARCDSLTDDRFEFGPCFESDPCSPNSCSPQQRCVPRNRVCLSINHKSCKQYDCVDIQQNCNLQLNSPVCDTENIEHNNLCWLLQKQKTLAYYGKCMHHCRSYGMVCGHNGETYNSECAAWAERVSVDYMGHCEAVGAFDGSTTTRCNSIRCPPLPSKYCPHVYPPGGCCPVCGAALRLLFTRQMTDWIVETISSVEPVVVQTLAEKLREHVKILECDVFAYLSVKSDIIALIITTMDHPTKVQIESCIKEAQKLESMIQKSSPTLLTDLSLSFISGATMIEPTNSSFSTKLDNIVMILQLIMVFMFFLYIV